MYDEWERFRTKSLVLTEMYTWKEPWKTLIRKAGIPVEIRSEYFQPTSQEIYCYAIPSDIQVFVFLIYYSPFSVPFTQEPLSLLEVLGLRTEVQRHARLTICVYFYLLPYSSTKLLPTNKRHALLTRISDFEQVRTQKECVATIYVIFSTFIGKKLIKKQIILCCGERGVEVC
jgi:hypothetical protein